MTHMTYTMMIKHTDDLEIKHKCMSVGEEFSWYFLVHFILNESILILSSEHVLNFINFELCYI